GLEEAEVRVLSEQRRDDDLGARGSELAGVVPADHLGVLHRHHHLYTLPVSRLFLIRHGETAGNASRTVQLPDNPLSSRGLAQAARPAERLAPEGLVQIGSSDFARARSTAEALRRASGAPLTFEPLLQERNFGDLRGTPYAELGLDMFALDYAPPNGETWEVFHA